MGYIYFNPNPTNQLVSDCVIRAISKLTNEDWETVYVGVTSMGFEMFDMPSSNRVWGEYLKSKGYERLVIPNTCPDCYTIRDFCIDHKKGKYLLATGVHVVAVIDGNYYDTWDSGGEIPIYYWRKETSKWQR